MHKSDSNSLFKAVFEYPTGLQLVDFIALSDDAMKSGQLVGTLSKSTYKTYNAQIMGFLNWFSRWEYRVGTCPENNLWQLLNQKLGTPFGLVDLYFGILNLILSISNIASIILGELSVVILSHAV